MTFSALPNNPVPIQEGKYTNRTWYKFFSDVWNGYAPASESAITVEQSPFTYNAPRGGFVIVQGGTVSLIQFARGFTNYNLGLTSGPIPVSANDRLIITYSVAPSMTFVPQ